MKQEMLLVAGMTDTLIWISVDPDQLTAGLFGPVDGFGMTSLMLIFFANCWAVCGFVRVNVPVAIWIVAVLQTGRLVNGMVSPEVNVTFPGSVTPGRFPPFPICPV